MIAIKTHRNLFEFPLTYVDVANKEAVLRIASGLTSLVALAERFGTPSAVTSSVRQSTGP